LAEGGLCRYVQPSLDDDMLADIVDVANDVVVPEAQDGPATALQISAACCIALRVFSVSVLAAINLDDQAVCRTGKINDIGSDWHLPAKAQPHQSMGAKLVPQFQLGLGHHTTHRFCVLALT
jgi:hypothetical protein